MIFKIPKVCIYLNSTNYESQHLTERDIGKLFCHSDIPDTGILSLQVYQLKNIQRDGSLVLQKIQRLCACHLLKDMTESLGSSDLTIPACKNDGLWHEVALQDQGMDSMIEQSASRHFSMLIEYAAWFANWMDKFLQKYHAPEIQCLPPADRDTNFAIVLSKHIQSNSV